MGGLGGVKKMRNWGLELWGEGRRIVCGGVKSKGKFVCLIKEVVSAVGDTGDDEMSCGRKAGRFVFPCAQKDTQKSNSFSVMSPLISIHPSNQFSPMY